MGQPLVTFVKGLFLVFNFVFWVSGLALLVIGIMAKFAFKYFMKLSTDIDYNLAPYVMIGCGVFIVLVGFCGCWAAIKQHSWVLKLYIFIMVLLVLSEIGGAIAGYVLKGKLASGLKEGMTNAVKNYYSSEDLRSAIDEIQASSKCCGVYSYQDYFNASSSSASPAINTTTPSATTTLGPVTNASLTTAGTTTLYINTTVALQNTTAAVETNSTAIRKRREADTAAKESVPQSCCIQKDGSGCHFKDLKGLKPDEMGIHTEGCYDRLFDIAKKNFGIVGGVAIGIAVFQMLGIICAYSLTQLFMKTNKYEQM